MYITLLNMSIGCYVHNIYDGIIKRKEPHKMKQITNIRKSVCIMAKLSILSELAKLLKISVTDGYKGMGFQQITQ